MTSAPNFSYADAGRSNWIRLQTLVILRWVAIIGQAAAILISQQVYDLVLPLGASAVMIGISVIANLFATVIYPENKRLSEREAVLWFVFDMLQLSLLLYLTGGLNNPFAILILAPVTIAATFLRLRQTILLGLMTIIALTLVARFHLPLITADGTRLETPGLLLFGFWLALVTGVVFLGLYTHRVINEMHNMSDALAATQLALAREQKLTDLGGVVAAAAHELGTPLATIKLVSSELIEELSGNDELRDDAALIRQQADRCRDILRSMGRAGKDDLHVRSAPLETVLDEAAEPHVDRGIDVDIQFSSVTNRAEQPNIARRPEIIHGLRNLIQNGVDFAKSKVEVEVGWTEDTITVSIADDGPGFPAGVIGRIGDPFVGRRSGSSRPGYDSMGLGLFIAKTLLERTGAALDFTNSGLRFETRTTRGARVIAAWPRASLVAPEAKGDNTLIES